MKKVSIHIRALTMCLAATILSSCAYSDQSSSVSASFPDSQATSETSSSASNKNLGSIEDDVPSNEITLCKALQISGKSTRANSKPLQIMKFKLRINPSNYIRWYMGIIRFYLRKWFMMPMVVVLPSINIM